MNTQRQNLFARLGCVAAALMIAVSLTSCASSATPLPAPAAVTAPGAVPSAPAADWGRQLELCQATLRGAGYSPREAAVRCTSHDVRELLAHWRGAGLPPGFVATVAEMATGGARGPSPAP